MFPTKECFALPGRPSACRHCWTATAPDHGKPRSLNRRQTLGRPGWRTPAPATSQCDPLPSSVWNWVRKPHHRHNGRYCHHRRYIRSAFELDPWIWIQRKTLHRFRLTSPTRSCCAWDACCQSSLILSPHRCSNHRRSSAANRSRHFLQTCQGRNIYSSTLSDFCQDLPSEPPLNPVRVWCRMGCRSSKCRVIQSYKALCISLFFDSQL